MRVGFIGAGNFSTMKIYPCLHRAPVELIAVCDLKRELAERNARWFGAEKVYTDYRQMFDKEKLDAVFIITGPKGHSTISLDALDAGLHVYVEKPPAEKSEDVKKMIEACKRNKKILMVGFMKRFAIFYQKAKEMMNSDDFGEPTMIDMKFTTGGYPTAEDFIFDYSIHFLDLVRYFMGDIAKIDAHKKVVKYGDAWRVSLGISLKFKSGAVGTMSLSSCQIWGSHTERVEVTGVGNYIIVDNLIRLERYKEGKGCIYLEEPNIIVGKEPHESLALAGYIGEVRHFAECVIEGKSPLVDITDGYEALKFVEYLQQVR